MESREFAALRKICFHSWWVVVFSVFCATWYVQASRGRDAAIAEVSSRLREMEKDLIAASREREMFSLRLQSESDPAWTELVLMKELGVVPEGWIKVQFKDPAAGSYEK